VKREDLQILGDDLYPDVAQMHAERREMFRLTAQRMLSGSTKDPHALKWARQIVATIPPLDRPLSEGAP